MNEYPFNEIDEKPVSDERSDVGADTDESLFSFDWMDEPDRDLIEASAPLNTEPPEEAPANVEQLMPLWVEEPIIDPYAHLDEPLMPFSREGEDESPKWPLPPSGAASSLTDSSENSSGVNQPSTFAEPFTPETFVPETIEENVRRSGLAWSAGIVFFSSIAFTLLLGWIGDLLLGTSPWGLVGGIVLGSIIGFIQFFRITSSIFKPKNSRPEIQPFMDHPDE